MSEEAKYFSTTYDGFDYKSLAIGNKELVLDEEIGTYLHPLKVAINAGGIITIVDSNGTRVIQGNPTSRGVAIFRQYYSEEDGYIYESCEHFHKGQTHVYPLKKIGYLDDNSRAHSETGIPLEIVGEGIIWRD